MKPDLEKMKAEMEAALVAAAARAADADAAYAVAAYADACFRYYTALAAQTKEKNDD